MYMYILCVMVAHQTMNSQFGLISYSIDNIDYVTGIGNSSCEQYIRAGNPCHLDLQEKPQKCTKKITKYDEFFKYF